MVVLCKTIWNTKPGTRNINLDNVPWYLRRAANKIIVACMEHGFLQHFRAISRYAFRLKNQPADRGQNGSEQMDFAMHWNTLGLGLLLATVGFGLEWLVHCRCRGR